MNFRALTPVNSAAIVNHMVNYSSKKLDPVFAALADPTRRAILARLTHGEATVTEVAEPFESSLPAISKHIKVLEKAGLVARRKDGRTHHLRLVASPLKNAAQWLEQYQWYLVFTWAWLAEPPETDSLVTVEFFEQDDSTRIVLKHEKLLTLQSQESHRRGWEGCLEQLELNILSAEI